MALSVQWTFLARKNLLEIFRFYEKGANLKVARKMVSGIVKETLKLPTHPFIGQREPLLRNKPEGFRYLIFSHFKIIYRLKTEEEVIEISNVFDTRQNPINIH